MAGGIWDYIAAHVNPSAGGFSPGNAYGYGSVAPAPTAPDIQPAALAPSAPVNPSFANAAGQMIGRAFNPSAIGEQIAGGNQMAASVIGGAGNFFRGLGGYGPAESPINMRNMQGRGLPATGIPQMNVPNAVPVSAGLPAAQAPPRPMARGPMFHAITPESAAAIAGLLPRQQTPQETAGWDYLGALKSQRDAVLNDAMRTPAEHAAAINQYMTNLESLVQMNQTGFLRQEMDAANNSPR